MTTLNKLAAEFDAWRRSKKRRNEPVPEKLLIKAQAMAQDLGTARVQRVTKLSQAQLRAMPLDIAVGGDGSANTVNEELTIVSVPRPTHGELELLLPGGLMVRCSDVHIGVELIKLVRLESIAKVWVNA